MEIRGDLRDTVDDLTEHNETCNARGPLQCDRAQMHALEIAQFMNDQSTSVREALKYILISAANMADYIR